MNNNYIDTVTELLHQINAPTIELLKKHLQESIEYVNRTIAKREDCIALTGGVSFTLVETNHTNHAEFMSNIFQIKNAQTLHDTFIWAYTTYYNKGFSFQYFFYELNAWKKFYQITDNEKFSSIISLYNYLISLHEYFIQHAISTQDNTPEIDDIKTYESFLNALLNTDLTEALEISNTYIQTKEDVVIFWEKIILPCLYTIGNKWAQAEISVGAEHSATSICQRIMAEHYGFIIEHIKDKRNILVTTSPNELHEVGALMLSDILELNGHNVTYLSSKTSTESLCETISTDEIEFILISTTLVGNIDRTYTMVKQIREEYKENTPKIILGGQAYKHNPTALEYIDADYYLKSTQELLDILDGVK